MTCFALKHPPALFHQTIPLSHAALLLGLLQDLEATKTYVQNRTIPVSVIVVGSARSFLCKMQNKMQNKMHTYTVHLLLPVAPGKNDTMAPSTKGESVGDRVSSDSFKTFRVQGQRGNDDI